MTRPLRIEFSGACYHVINRGLGGHAIYHDDRDRELFLNLLREVSSRWGLQVYAYCLLDNLYHLCVQTPTIPLSRIMRHIDGVYTQKFNRRYRREGPLFRGRYKSILIEQSRFLLTVIRHIHLKPLELKDVGRPEGYPWSSLQYYLAERRKPSWLNTSEVMQCLGGNRFRSREFLSAPFLASTEEIEYRPESQGPLLGSEEFRERVRSGNGSVLKEREIPERKYLAVAIRTCVKKVAEVYGTEEGRIKFGRRGKRNEPRQVAMFICREAGGYKHREIAQAFKASSYSTVSSACAILRRRMEKEEGLRARVTAIFDSIRR